MPLYFMKLEKENERTSIKVVIIKLNLSLCLQCHYVSLKPQ